MRVVANIGPAEDKDGGQLKAYIDQLKQEVRDLGKLDGVISPSIYDTAQLLRFEPPANPDDVEKLVDWLLRQQQPDGGWGGEEGSDSLPRHVPTLAAVLALHEKAPESRKAQAQAAVSRGIGFLRWTAKVWRRDSAGSLPDDIPVAAELTLPLLLSDKTTQRLLKMLPRRSRRLRALLKPVRRLLGRSRGPFKMPQRPLVSQRNFNAVHALGARRKRLITGMLYMASRSSEGRAPMHTWEAWDKKAGLSFWLARSLMPWPIGLGARAMSLGLWPAKLGLWPVKMGLWLYLKKRGPMPGVEGMDAMDVMDGSGGIGHSPVATAVWLRALRELKNRKLLWRLLDKQRFQRLEQSATDFLERSSKATLTSIPGAVPTVWPINRFEQTWALFGLYVMGLLKEGPVMEAARPQLDELRQVLNKNKGLGMSDHFVCDGDITATTVSLMVDTGRSHPLDRVILDRFMRGQHFITYDYELQPSVTTTAHATLAFALVGRDTSHLVGLLLGWQDPEGYWRGDKWHKSWLYTTAQVMIALAWAEKKRLLRADGQDALRRGLKALLDAQHPGGGWGFTRVSTLAETAYAVQALYALKDLPLFDTVKETVGKEDIKTALRRAARWMTAQEAHEADLRRASGEKYSIHKEKYWIGKELYCPYRVDRVFELSALVALQSDPELRSTP
ncbi:prenyltransferase/squalene oxidase repeat-containing protein [Archangium lipolyticum]|uniref:prenyltransferase/squalene oxidase repeat-containing protein n=1 Tax=Archangium lipolyticum TaxID=2970465 RepID=UPI002149EED3|nr:prenyltransferase/squalene oxidase repeat-containing protein [Archangium lipolyticum]